MPKLSVIMPVYNTAKFLGRAIDSVLDQTFSDFELILVNDGSKDNSLDICRAYEQKDSRIKVIDKENGGAGSARNAGVAASSGEFVAFPDSDDWVEPDAYAFCIDEMEEKNLDLLVFGSLNTVYGEDGEVLSIQEGKMDDLLFPTQKECRNAFANLVRNYPMDGPSNKMYRGKIVRDPDVTFPDLRRMQDGVFNMRYFNKISSLELVKKYFYHFTQHPSDFQRKKMPAAFLDCAVAYHKEAIGFLKSWGLLTDDAERLFGDWFSETIEVASFEYLPTDGKSLFRVRRHVRDICKNDYVKAFYKRYSELTPLRKTERALAHGWALPLAILAKRRS